MKIKIFYLVLIGLLTAYAGFAQNLNPDTSIAVRINGNYVDNPWTGGFNSPHFSEIDLNQDGILDLFAFDRDGNRVTTYINEGKSGQVSYKYAPEYRSKFPDLHDWALLVDFNCDGKNDLFTYTYLGGMSVFKNTSNPTDGLKFDLEYSLIYSFFGANYVNLYVSPVNQPVLIDVDGDTDLDVITFTLTGSILEYHINAAMEDYSRCDTLVYTLDPSGCWGNFSLSPFTNTAILNQSCRTSPLVFNYPDPQQHNGLHAGSCMLGLDIDDDNDIDLINGDLLGNNLLMLVNGGDNLNANITSQDTAFPSYDVPVDLIRFPASYFVDVNNDNAKDLLVAPCVSGGAEDFFNIHYYKNTATTQAPVFELTNSQMFVDNMIEVGSGANVEVYDVNQDGLMDMLIGNYGYFSAIPPLVSGISYYQNIGTANAPEFNLITRDFMGLYALNLTGIHPCFGDIDSDGDDDMIIGDADGNLHHFRNTAGAGNPVNYVLVGPNFQNIDVGQFSAPYLFDLNGDNLLDLIIGEKGGNLNYYENTGTSSAPTYTFVTDTLGHLNVKEWWDISGYSDPLLYFNGANIELLVGSKRGTVFYYDHITGNINGPYTEVDTTFENINEKFRTTIARYDIDNDGTQDILTGNYAGGVIWYSSTSTVGIDNPESTQNFSIYPNPSDDWINVKLNTTTTSKENFVSIFNVTGQLIYESTFNYYKTRIYTANWSPGLYIIKVHSKGELPTAQKLIVR